MEYEASDEAAADDSESPTKKLCAAASDEVISSIEALMDATSKRQVFAICEVVGVTLTPAECTHQLGRLRRIAIRLATTASMEATLRPAIGAERDDRAAEREAAHVVYADVERVRREAMEQCARLSLRLDEINDDSLDVITAQQSACVGDVTQRVSVAKRTPVIVSDATAAAKRKRDGDALSLGDASSSLTTHSSMTEWLDDTKEDGGDKPGLGDAFALKKLKPFALVYDGTEAKLLTFIGAAEAYRHDNGVSPKAFNRLLLSQNLGPDVVASLALFPTGSLKELYLFLLETYGVEADLIRAHAAASAPRMKASDPPKKYMARVERMWAEVEANRAGIEEPKIRSMGQLFDLQQSCGLLRAVCIVRAEVYVRHVLCDADTGTLIHNADRSQLSAAKHYLCQQWLLNRHFEQVKVSGDDRCLQLNKWLVTLELQ